jgi:hypothetical protein
LPDTADFAPPAPGEACAGERSPDDIFVRALDLPTLSIKQARAAVAQQIDILSPLPPAQVASSVVLIGPVEEGLNRFAVGFAPRDLLTRLTADGVRAVILKGWLDEEEIAFRFERPGAAPGRPDWTARLELATIAGLCLAVVMAGASVRMDREIDRVQARIDVASADVQQLSGEAASLARVGAAWRAAGAAHNAALVDCALGGLARASGGPVSVAKFAVADGRFRAHLSAPPSDVILAALRAFGLSSPLAATPADPATVMALRDIQTSGADCR